MYFSKFIFNCMWVNVILRTGVETQLENMKLNFLSWFQYQNGIYKHICDITILKILSHFSLFLYRIHVLLLSLITNINKSLGIAKTKSNY